jgi:nucleoside-diphosphate-sugar epimerase
LGKLEGKIALVTGGNSGIGLATAKQFVNEGAYVFVTGRREAELARAVKEIGINVISARTLNRKKIKNPEGVFQQNQYSGLTLSGTPTLFFQAHHFCRNFIYEFLMMTWQNSHPQKIG